MTPNHFDQACRFLAKLHPHAFFFWLMSRLPAVLHFRGWLDTRTVPFPGESDRTCDTVAAFVDEAAPDTPWALPIEFQTRPDLILFGRLLEYLGRLWCEFRRDKGQFIHYDVAGAVVNLTGRGRTSRTMEIRKTGVWTSLQVVERNLCEEDAAETLAAIVAGDFGRVILPFIPLMRGGGNADIIERWKQLVESEASEKRRADYAGLAMVFAELTPGRSACQQALEDWNVVVSQQVLEWQEKARLEGEAKGRLEGEADALLDLLELRFPLATTADLATLIRSAKNLAQLKRWFAAAVRAATFEEFQRQIAKDAPVASNGEH